MIEDLLQGQAGNHLWTLVDLEDGFHQVPLLEECRHLTAFCTPAGTFEWRALPMGVKVGPQAFHRLVSWCVGRLKPHIRAYIDDILVGTRPTCSGKEKLLDSAQTQQAGVRQQQPQAKQVPTGKPAPQQQKPAQQVTHHAAGGAQADDGQHVQGADDNGHGGNNNGNGNGNGNDDNGNGEGVRDGDDDDGDFGDRRPQDRHGRASWKTTDNGAYWGPVKELCESNPIVVEFLDHP